MTEPTATTASPAVGASLPDHVDVLIVGAGLSGVGAACHLSRRQPVRRYLILEARESMGGTWDLFRYPGIRSDSDMYTLGFRFKPWEGAKSIADGGDILDYIRETAREYGVDRHIRYQRRVTALSWDSATARWTATVSNLAAGTTETITASFVHGCTGYYRYDEGFTPDYPGLDRFQGTFIHPQHWPEDHDPRGKRHVVIGSGATAMTLVPSLAKQAEGGHVTMLQRSPTYVLSQPAKDPVAKLLRRLLPKDRAYAAIRWKNVALSSALYQLSRRFPRAVKAVLLRLLQRQLPTTVDVATHFTPTYDPWDQRLCLVPNNDLFRALRAGRASVVTDHIASFTETGIQLRSGEHLEADVVISATGLNLLLMGGIDFEVDGRRIEPNETVAYKGMMLSGVPNFAFAIGYTNASWTLKIDLANEYLCRLLAHMDRRGVDTVWPQPPGPDADLRPLIDLDSGYIKRVEHQLPKQASRQPWTLHQNYLRDIQLFRRSDLDDEGVRFARSADVAPSGAPVDAEVA